jgi:hypothetical protein
MNSMRKFKKGDLILVLAVLVLGIAVSIPYLGNYFGGGTKPGESLIAVITRDGKVMEEVDLNKVQEPQSFTFEDGIKVTILAEKGTIRFIEADCPDKICIKTGLLTKPADRAVCLPSKTIVKIKDI